MKWCERDFKCPPILTVSQIRNEKKTTTKKQNKTTTTKTRPLLTMLDGTGKTD